MKRRSFRLAELVGCSQSMGGMKTGRTQIILPLGQSSVGALNVGLTVHINRITQALIGCTGESPFDRDVATLLVAEFAKPLPQRVQRPKWRRRRGEHPTLYTFTLCCASLTSGATTMLPPLMAMNASRSITG